MSAAFEMKIQSHQDNSGYAKDSVHNPDQLQDRLTTGDNRRCQCSIINRNNDKRIQHPLCAVKVCLSVENKAVNRVNDTQGERLDDCASGNNKARIQYTCLRRPQARR